MRKLLLIVSSFLILTIACQGPPGPAGQRGELGPQGPTGLPGTAPSEEQLIQLIRKVLGPDIKRLESRLDTLESSLYGQGYGKGIQVGPYGAYDDIGKIRSDVNNLKSSLYGKFVPYAYDDIGSVKSDIDKLKRDINQLKLSYNSYR